MKLKRDDILSLKPAWARKQIVDSEDFYIFGREPGCIVRIADWSHSAMG